MFEKTLMGIIVTVFIGGIIAIITGIFLGAKELFFSKKCPFCKKNINKEATKCPFCQSTLQD